MKPLPPTASRIQDAALIRFAAQGFAEASMVEIASDVGIKKPSVYAHFKSKDELYLSLIPIVVAAELEHARAVFVGGETIKAQIQEYLRDLQLRPSESAHGHFWLRALWFPPVHLHDQVMAFMHKFLNELELIIKNALESSPLVPNDHNLSATTLTLTCMAMIDSLQSELLYANNAKYERRLKALWEVFEAATAARKN